MIHVSAIPSSHVLEVWPEVAVHLRKAVKRTRGKYEIDDVLMLLLNGHSQLWVAFEDEIKGAVTTHFVQYPRKKYLFLHFCGGVDGMLWKDSMLNTLRTWAEANLCDGIEAFGRDGWGKIFAGDGYQPTLRGFELSLTEQE